MHHVVLERWSRQESTLHRRDARAKILAMLALLVALASIRGAPLLMGSAYFLLLACAILVAKLPLVPILLRAMVVLPFAATFAAVSLLVGDSERAVALLVKSYVSALAVLALAGTTPLPQLLRGLESLGVPRFLVLVVQFLYRYLFVISEQAQHMRLSASCRGSFLHGPRRRGSGFRAAAGALGVLFARSYLRAESIHRAMLARGFAGRFPMSDAPRLGWADLALVLVTICCAVGVRLIIPGGSA